jgi:tetratricopeptide (TPR) repeat protein
LKIALRIAGILLLGTLAAGSVAAGPKARKLTPDAYIKTAKIEIITGDTTRYQYSIVMLDSLLLNYGPYAEAYYWMTKIMVDFHEKNGDLIKKKPYVEKMVAYADSLHMVCADPKARSANKKGCDKFVKDIDSVKARFWLDFYRSGVNQLKAIDSQSTNLKTETDSTAIAEARNIIKQNTDSCLANMDMAIIIDPKDSRPYIGLASAYEKQGDFEKSNDWLAKGLERASEADKIGLIQQLAYNYIQMDKYCDAVPYFEKMVALIPKDTAALGTMYNLSICYNRCKNYDSAVSVYRAMVNIQPTHVDALTGIGRYFNEMARRANDSSQRYDSLKDETGVKKWADIRRRQFDSSRVYLKRVFDLTPNDAAPAEEYGVVSQVIGNYAEALTAFERVTKLDPSNIGAWTSLGDCLVYAKRFKEAADAYEKVIAAEPKNRTVLEQLGLLYDELKQPAKVADIEARLKKL